MPRRAAATSTTWTFPNNVILGPGEFRVVFCDSRDTNTSQRGDPLGELDTGFNLSKAGATLELINASCRSRSRRSPTRP